MVLLNEKRKKINLVLVWFLQPSQLCSDLHIVRDSVAPVYIIFNFIILFEYVLLGNDAK